MGRCVFKKVKKGQAGLVILMVVVELVHWLFATCQDAKTQTAFDGSHVTFVIAGFILLVSVLSEILHRNCLSFATFAFSILRKNL